jgi:hypothetical protein
MEYLKLLEEYWVWHIGISIFFILYSYYIMYKLFTDSKKFHYIDMAIKLLFISTIYMLLHIYRIIDSLDMKSFKIEYKHVYDLFN